MKVVKERLQEFVGVVDPLHVPPNDPDHVRPGLGVVCSVEILAERGDDRLVLVGVLPEDVLDDDHELLDDVVDLGLDQVQQGRQPSTILLSKKIPIL